MILVKNLFFFSGGTIIILISLRYYLWHIYICCVDDSHNEMDTMWPNVHVTKDTILVGNGTSNISWWFGCFIRHGGTYENGVQLVLSTSTALPAMTTAGGGGCSLFRNEQDSWSRLKNNVFNLFTSRGDFSLCISASPTAHVGQDSFAPRGGGGVVVVIGGGALCCFRQLYVCMCVGRKPGGGLQGRGEEGKRKKEWCARVVICFFCKRWMVNIDNEYDDGLRWMRIERIREQRIQVLLPHTHTYTYIHSCSCVCIYSHRQRHAHI